MHELALANYAETFMSSDSFEMQKKIDAVEPAGIDLAGRAAAYLLDNLDGRVTIGELSGFVGVSPTYLKTAFREKYGMPVYSWYKVEKMNEASRLLAETDMSIRSWLQQCQQVCGSLPFCDRDAAGALSPDKAKNVKTKCEF